MAKYTPLSEGKCEKGSEKRREEVIKKKYIYIHMGVCDECFTSVECQEE